MIGVLGLALVQVTSVGIDATTRPHTVKLECKVVAINSDEIIEFDAVVDYSGGKPSKNHHTRVIVETSHSDWPKADTTPIDGGRFSAKPFAVVPDWQGQTLFYNFDIPARLGSVDENGVALMEILVHGVRDRRVGAGICDFRSESLTQ